MFTIYLITNLVNDKIYVGQTNQFLERRWTLHKCRARRNEGYTAHLYNAMRKYGIDSFVIKEVMTCETSEQANYLESIWIILLDSMNPKVGYNMTSGGDRREPTPEAIEKARQKKLGTKRTEEAKRKTSESLRIAWAEGRHTGVRGKKLSPETCEKMSKRMTGRGSHNFLKNICSEELVFLWNNGVTTTDISKRFGISTDTVRRRIKKSGLPFRPFWEVKSEQAKKVERRKIDETLLRELLKMDISLREIGRRLGVAHNTISSKMKKLGITRV